MYKLRWVRQQGLILLLLSVFAASSAQASLDTCEDFLSNSAIGSLLKDYEKQNPAVAQYINIGKSVEGRSIHGLVISPGSGDTLIPYIRVIGAIHGNECLSAKMVLKIIDALITGEGTDSEWGKIIKTTAFVFVPLVNPDGHESRPAIRFNHNGVDLNRNFSFGWSSDNNSNGSAPFSEPESRAIRDLEKKYHFVMGLSYHTAALYVNSAWNYTPYHPRDEDLFTAIGESYAGSSSYNVVFGWDWYQISGDVNDWSLGTNGTFDWTIEIPSDTEFNWTLHEPGVLNYFVWASKGVHGTVIDARNGNPLKALITIEPEGEPVYSDSSNGSYHRVLMPGIYEVTAWASGYKPKTISNVKITSDKQAVLNFRLDHDYSAQAALSINSMTMDRDITNSYYAQWGYENQTLPSDALGMRDGWFYSIGYNGAITLDMGEETPVTDIDGDDFIVVSGTLSSDTARVLVAQNEDDNFIEVLTGQGDISADIAATGLEWIRFIKIVDTGNSEFGEADGGYDLDAIEPVSDEPIVFAGCTQVLATPKRNNLWNLFFLLIK